MRPGRTQTGTSSYRPPYISSYAFTRDWPDNELRLVWLRLGCWNETRNSRTDLSSYRSHVNDNKSQTGSKNLLLGQPYIYETKHIILSRNQAPNISSLFHVNGSKNFIPVQVHTGLSLSRSHVNTLLGYSGFTLSSKPNVRVDMICFTSISVGFSLLAP